MTDSQICRNLEDRTRAQPQQKPHRHQSIALDFISDCKPGCYTLVGTELDGNGNIVVDFDELRQALDAAIH